LVNFLRRFNLEKKLNTQFLTFILVDVTMMYLGLSLGVVLAVLGAIVGAIIRKRRQLSSKMADAERSNRLTQLRFVREAF